MMYRKILLFLFLSFSLIGAEVTSSSVAHAFSDSYKFLKAVRKRNMSDVHKYINNGVNINTREEEEGKTALYIAVSRRDSELARLLTYNGAKPNIPHKSTDETPLMVAAKLGDKLCLAILLLAKADVNLIDNNGETALIKTLQSRNLKVMELLLKNGADTSIADFSGRTVLRHARENGRVRRIVKLLEKYHAEE